MRNLKVGNYFLFAELNNDKLFAEWLIPVHIDVSGQIINLDNSNTASIAFRSQ